MNHQLCLAVRGVRRNRAREQFWRDVFKRFAESGRGVRAFCKSRNLSEGSFYCWRRTLAERDTAVSSGPGRPGTPPAFLPVHLTDPIVEPLEIVLGGGRRIRLRGPVDRGALAEVVQALESIPARSEPC